MGILSGEITLEDVPAEPEDEKLRSDNTDDDNDAWPDIASNKSVDFGFFTAKTDLKLTKTVSKPSAKTGDTLTYTLLLENESDVDATGVVVNDKLPTTLTYVSHTPATASYASDTGDWTVGTLAARQKITLTINVTVK